MRLRLKWRGGHSFHSKIRWIGLLVVLVCLSFGCVTRPPLSDYRPQLPVQTVATFFVPMEIRRLDQPVEQAQARCRLEADDDAVLGALGDFCLALTGDRVYCQIPTPPDQALRGSGAP